MSGANNTNQYGELTAEQLSFLNFKSKLEAEFSQQDYNYLGGDKTTATGNGEEEDSSLNETEGTVNALPRTGISVSLPQVEPVPRVTLSVANQMPNLPCMQQAMSLEAVLAAINANIIKSEELASAREERLYKAMAQSRDEVLGLVSNEINQVATELRGESNDLAAQLRAEAETRHETAHRESEVAAGTAAKAVAMVEDLRAEFQENQSAVATRMRKEEVDPLREEMKVELARRDEQLKVLQELFIRDDSAPRIPQVEPVPRVTLSVASQMPNLPCTPLPFSSAHLVTSRHMPLTVTTQANNSRHLVATTVQRPAPCPTIVRP